MPLKVFSWFLIIVNIQILKCYIFMSNWISYYFHSKTKFMLVSPTLRLEVISIVNSQIYKRVSESEQ